MKRTSPATLMRRAANHLSLYALELKRGSIRPDKTWDDEASMKEYEYLAKLASDLRSAAKEISPEKSAPENRTANLGPGCV